MRDILTAFCKRNKEVILYVFFGGVTFFLNMGLFWLMERFTPLHAAYNNAICWVACVVFQFFTNRMWVFEGSASVRGVEFVKQLLGFFGGRIFTLILEEAILLVGIELFRLDTMMVKLAGQLVVIVLNYVISKLFIFKPKH